MTDILTKLAALTEEGVHAVPRCPFCNSVDGSKRHDDGRFWWHCDACGATGPALSRYSEEDEPCWESRPREAALIALVQEAAGEIERLREWQRVALAIGERAEARLVEQALNPQESAP